MDPVTISMNGKPVAVSAGKTILEAARQAEIYIPSLCSHPDLPPANGAEAAKAVYQGDCRIENAAPEKTGRGCGLCVVEVEGVSELVSACTTDIADGMAIITESDRIKAERQEKLAAILTRHPHACLTCAQQEGCSRTECSSNVPENERCCPQFGHCELQDVANYIGIRAATPKWVPTELPILKNDPLFERDYNLCIGCTRCVRACRDLRGIEAVGFVYDRHGQVQVGTLAQRLAESGCRFCTACVDVCPTGALMDKGIDPGTRKADLVPCKAACPVQIDVPEYLRLIGRGKADQALAVIREKTPFPGILGRVCPHPCETACRRADINDAVSICALKRYAADEGKSVWKQQRRVKPDTGRKAAIVGAGPAGLTAAYYLRKQGHSVTVFESREKPGGMMRYGIPAFRLPAAVLENEIADILELGIDLRTNQTLGKDVTLAELTNNGFDAVFIATGLQSSRRIDIPGSDLPDVLWGMEFLSQIAAGKDMTIKNRVIVVGGGNVAVDVALSALRIGAEDVTLVCLECEAEMPAHAWELDGAVAEGVTLMPSWGPEKILSQDGRITGMQLVQCTCVFDADGNFCPEFGDDRKQIPADHVILAIGQASNLGFVENERRISKEKGLILVNADTLETGMPGVYAGGDVTAASGAVVHAVQAGRQAAINIDEALGGDGSIDDMHPREVPDPLIGRDEGFALRPREKMPEISLDRRRVGFREVLVGYSAEAALAEAGRCLRCDLRLHMGCNPSPPKSWMTFDAASIQNVSETEGVFQLFDENGCVVAIKGTANLKTALLEALEDHHAAVRFSFEEDKLYSQRESELIQRHLQAHGEMPGEADDDLF